MKLGIVYAGSKDGLDELFRRARGEGGDVGEDGFVSFCVMHHQSLG